MLNFKSHYQGKNTHLRNKGERNQNQPYKETLPRKNGQRWDSDYQLQGCDMDHAPENQSTWHRHDTQKIKDR